MIPVPVALVVAWVVGYRVRRRVRGAWTWWAGMGVWTLVVAWVLERGLRGF